MLEYRGVIVVSLHDPKPYSKDDNIPTETIKKGQSSPTSFGINISNDKANTCSSMKIPEKNKLKTHGTNWIHYNVHFDKSSFNHKFKDDADMNSRLENLRASFFRIHQDDQPFVSDPGLSFYSENVVGIDEYIIRDPCNKYVLHFSNIECREGLSMEFDYILDILYPDTIVFKCCEKLDLAKVLGVHHKQQMRELVIDANGKPSMETVFK